MSVRQILAVFALFSLAACAADQAAPADDAAADAESELRKTKNDLSSEDEKKVLNMLDDVCGDTWCEGDYQWWFKKLRCSFDAKSCTLTMLVVDPAYDDKPTRTFWRSCKISGLSGKDALTDVAANGYESLDDAFYDRVSDCVDGIESRIPAR